MTTTSLTDEGEWDLGVRIARNKLKGDRNEHENPVSSLKHSGHSLHMCLLFPPTFIWMYLISFCSRARRS